MEAHIAALAATVQFMMCYFSTAVRIITSGMISFNPMNPNMLLSSLSNKTLTEDAGNAWTSRAQVFGMEKLANRGEA